MPIDGAFYACVRLPSGGDSLAAALELVEHRGVAVVPGRAFGDSLEGWLRLSWVAPIEQVEEGLRRIVDALAGGRIVARAKPARQPNLS